MSKFSRLCSKVPGPGSEVNVGEHGSSFSGDPQERGLLLVFLQTKHDAWGIPLNKPHDGFLHLAINPGPCPVAFSPPQAGPSIHSLSTAHCQASPLLEQGLGSSWAGNHIKGPMVVRGRNAKNPNKAPRHLLPPNRPYLSLAPIGIGATLDNHRRGKGFGNEPTVDARNPAGIYMESWFQGSLGGAGLCSFTVIIPGVNGLPLQLIIFYGWVPPKLSLC